MLMNTDQKYIKHYRRQHIHYIKFYEINLDSLSLVPYFLYMFYNSSLCTNFNNNNENFMCPPFNKAFNKAAIIIKEDCPYLFNYNYYYLCFWQQPNSILSLTKNEEKEKTRKIKYLNVGQIYINNIYFAEYIITLVHMIPAMIARGNQCVLECK